MALIADQVVEKIQNLSSEQLTEVARFIDGLEDEESDSALTRACMRLSSPVFEKIWSNPEDAIYDDL